MTFQSSDRHAKGALRSLMLARRDQLPAEARAAASAQVVARAAAGLVQLARGAVLGLYAAKGSELDLRALDEVARQRGHAVAYPRVVRGQPWLEFALAEPTELVEGAFGLREPAPRAERVALERVAAFFVPGLAFDERGGRLGWGRGYYDSTFVQAPSALRLGVAFECQVVERVPCAAHDVLLHELLTEAQGRRFGV